MHMLVYLILAVVIYGVLADRTDRAVEREMRKRQPPGDLRLVEDFDVRPDLNSIAHLPAARRIRPRR